MSSTSLRNRAFEQAPVCSSKWIALSTDERTALIKRFIEQNTVYSDTINLCDVAENGFVTIDFKHALGPNERGGFLLDFEHKLKQSVDVGLTVWLKPLGDRSSLRNLRGIEVKND
jgi:hypothetical protein